MDSWKIVFVVTCVVVIAVIGGATVLSIRPDAAQGVVSAQTESVTNCIALGADTFVIRINDDRIHSPAKSLEAGLKLLLEENPNKKIKSITSVQRAHFYGTNVGSSTEAIIIVLE